MQGTDMSLRQHSLVTGGYIMRLCAPGVYKKTSSVLKGHSQSKIQFTQMKNTLHTMKMLTFSYHQQRLMNYWKYNSKKLF